MMTRDETLDRMENYVDLSGEAMRQGEQLANVLDLLVDGVDSIIGVDPDLRKMYRARTDAFRAARQKALLA